MLIKHIISTLHKTNDLMQLDGVFQNLQEYRKIYPLQFLTLIARL